MSDQVTSLDYETSLIFYGKKSTIDIHFVLLRSDYSQKAHIMPKNLPKTMYTNIFYFIKKYVFCHLTLYFEPCIASTLFQSSTLFHLGQICRNYKIGRAPAHRWLEKVQPRSARSIFCVSYLSPSAFLDSAVWFLASLLLLAGHKHIELVF